MFDARDAQVTFYSQELHNAFDYDRDLIDAERGETMRYLFKCLRSVGISAYVDGLSWS